MMKAYELLKLAAENPQAYEGKKYKVVSGVAINYFGKSVNEFVIDDGAFQDIDMITVYISNYTEVEEIPQPVSFTEAIQESVINGTIARCVRENVVTEYKFLLGVSSSLIDQCGHPITADEILNGTWYIVT